MFSLTSGRKVSNKTVSNRIGKNINIENLIQQARKVAVFDTFKKGNIKAEGVK